MAKYVSTFQATSWTNAKTVGTIRADGTTARRQKWYDIIFGTSSTPADAAISWTVTRVSAAGAGTAGGTVTPAVLDPADAAALADTHEAFSAEPTTYDSEPLLRVSLNQRATFRWVAAPGSELVTAATVSIGAGIRMPVISTGTPDADATVYFEEQ
jgi:hypothetical protein